MVTQETSAAEKKNPKRPAYIPDVCREMSGVRSLRIRLGLVNVGYLFAMDDGRTYFIEIALQLTPLKPSRWKTPS